MLWIDKKYANMVGIQFSGYKIVSNSPFIANFRCPICGDSIKREKKARGYLLEKKNKIFFFCHNCNSSLSLLDFLECQSPNLFNEYRIESLKNKWNKVAETPQKNIFYKPVVFSTENNLGPLLINTQNKVKNYAIERKIPEHFYGSLHSCENISDFIKQFEKYQHLDFQKEPALIIPFYTKNREYSYVSCRSILKHSSFRYYVLEINNIYPKLWGLEYIDWNNPCFIFEGQIDAMCIPNSLALAGASGSETIDYISKNVKKISNVCFVYDNDYLYNIHILRQIKKRIDQGFSVVIYDKNFLGKDVNQVICNNSMTSDEVYEYLQKRTFNGIRAQLELAHQKLNAK